MDTDSGLVVSKRRVDDWLAARPRTTAFVYFAVLSAAWASAEFFLGGRALPRAVLFGAAFGALYVALAWFWGDLGDRTEQ